MKTGASYLVFLCPVLAVYAMSHGETGAAVTSVQAGGQQEASNIRDRWGIEIVAIRLSAAGQMLDFRYRVIEPDKAAPILDPRANPYLIDQKSGARLAVPITPIVGALRQTVRSGKPVAMRTYGVLFGNPGRFVAPGDEVTVVVGDFRAEGLMVQ